ncbi:MAG: ABC transporter substrate-binding protein [Chloroflexi bacterium]|nr:ABC transporter substrate-binding protein [Chloroflexota bacterium]
MLLRKRFLAAALLMALLLVACARAAPTATPTRAPVAAPTATPTRAAPAAATPTPTTAPVVRAAPTTTPIPATPTPTARVGPKGTLNVIDEMATELWLIRISQSDNPLDYVGEPLMGWNWGADAPVNNSLLESWSSKVNADGSVDWTFKIRKGVKFHKGWGEVTAEDVKSSLADYLKPGSVSPHASTLVGFFGKDSKNLTAVDTYTLGIHQPSQTNMLEIFRSMSADHPTSLRPYPKKYMEQVGEDGFNKVPVFAGPYEFVSQQRGYDVRLKAVPDHYRVTPGFAEIHYFKVLEEATKVAMLRSGQVDVAPVAARFASELKSSGIRIAVSENALEPFVGLGGMFPGRPKCDPTVPWVGGCTAEAMLSGNPLKVRRALNLDVDRQAIVDKIQFGYGEQGIVSFSFISPKFPWWNPDWKPLPYDPKQAKQLLTEAGYPNCFEFKFYFIAGQSYSADVGEAVASTWEKDLGCKINRVLQEYRPTLRTMLVERTSAGWAYLFEGSPIARPFRYACFHGGPAYEVIVHTEQPYFTELCSKLNKTLDPAEMVSIEKQIGDNEYKYYPTVAISLVHQTFGVGPKVKKWEPVPTDKRAGLLEYAEPK